MHFKMPYDDQQVHLFKKLETLRLAFSLVRNAAESSYTMYMLSLVYAKHI